MKEKLIVIVGPTAVGKTALGVKLAQKYGGEIISGDSMQVYKEMDIGTAKVTEEEQEGVPHYLIDIKNPNESFSVAEFQERCVPLITNINRNKKIPLLVGGTGLYVNAIIKQYQFEAMPTDETYRQELEQLATSVGNHELHNMLEKVDPQAAKSIHPNNLRRVIRALEVTKATGIPFSKQQTAEDSESPYDYVMIGLTMDRQKLYERIDDRVDLMMEQGLIKEVKFLYERGIRDCQSVQAIGYKEIYEFLEGSATLEEAVDKLKQNSRRYAKRQLTWFRNKTNTTWFDVSAGMNQQTFNEICLFIEGEFPSLSN
ncbi:tRNA (adenosine(37)-N6)-dimethylallyltransferase MiaA [Halalkalibacter akibai]|uniref:tRNA dimethylallyltransferase n=1 Tax=Halalkalibacter akibai (strain ATCC 43226 / DSM 21942 / CIP 109018 / JCM 9157 / 1139) TaxID=1236973 RepID=W4QTM9_HALA3|nr:tRNA (adenosine(37)-N6)-dimethylallyltransferase MiaA [Halalkalibacter akibai]GAE34694.1 tRNA delta(2)-isopentenylpyrophosphate transferase [Halalkalibacter akibai JCM 9157]